MVDITSTGNQTIWDEEALYSVGVTSAGEMKVSASLAWDDTNKVKLWDETDDVGVEGDRLLVSSKSKTEECIDSGCHYFIEGYTSLDVNGTIAWVFTTPTTTPIIHMLFSVGSSAGFEIDMYEGSTGVTGGTSMTPFNSNRGSTNTSDATVVSDPTAITDGTLIMAHKYGGLKETGFISADDEIILKANTTYLWRFTSQYKDNLINFRGHWTEE